MPEAPVSPYDPIFAAYPTEAIPFAFRSQFLRSPGDPNVSVVSGDLDRVWSRPAVLRPLIAAFGRLGLIAPGLGTGVPARLALRPGVDARGRPYQVCDRSFTFGRPLPFVTRKVWEPDLGRIIEFCGPAGAVVVDWDTRFEPPDTLRFTSLRMGLNIRDRVMWLPGPVSRWLFGTTTFTQVAADDRTFQIELVVRHPLLGAVFGYDGRLALREEPA